MDNVIINTYERNKTFAFHNDFLSPFFDSLILLIIVNVIFSNHGIIYYIYIYIINQHSF